MYHIRVCSPLVCQDPDVSSANTEPKTPPEQEADASPPTQDDSKPHSFFGALFPQIVGDKSPDLAWRSMLPLTFSPRVVIHKE
jgi:hypothetical protein